jgi:hypothetical protein
LALVIFSLVVQAKRFEHKRGCCGYAGYQRVFAEFCGEDRRSRDLIELAALGAPQVIVGAI